MQPELQNRPKKIAKLIALVIAVSLALAACGGSDASVETSAVELPSLAGDDAETTGDDPSEGEAEAAGPPTEEDIELAMAEYEACLGEAGIDISQFTSGGGAAVEELEVEDNVVDEDFDFEAFEAAAAECEAALDGAFGDFELSPEEEAEFADAALAMERCIGEAGLDIELDGEELTLPDDVDFAEFEAVLKACEQSIDLFNQEDGQ